MVIMTTAHEVLHPGAGTTSVSGRWAEIFRFLLVGLMFVVLPFGLFELSLQVLRETRTTRAVERLKMRHEKILSRINMSDDEIHFAARLIRSAFQRMAERGPRRGRKDVGALNAHLPNALDLFFFDGKGVLIPEISSRGFGRKYIERCYRIVGDIKHQGKTSPENQGMLRQLLKMARVESLRNYQNGKGMPIGQDPSAGYFSYEVPEKPGNMAVGGYLAFFRPHQFPRDFAARAAIAEANRRYPECRMGLVDLEAAPPLFFPETLRTHPGLRSALMKSRSAYDEVYVDGALALTVVQRRRSGNLVALNQIPEPFSPLWPGLGRLALLIWALCLLSNVRNGTLFADSRISGRITRLFLFSVGLPAVLLLIGGYRALEDHILVLQDGMERTMRAKLRQFDERFPLEVVRIENRLQAWKKEVEARGGKRSDAGIFRQVEKERSITDFLVIDSGGNSVWELTKALSPEVAQRYQVGRIMAREIMKRINQVEKIDGGTFLTESVSSVMGTMIQAGGWELFQRNLGQFTPFGLDKEGCFMLFDAVYKPGGGADMMISVVMFRGRAEEEYFKRHRKELEQQPDLRWQVSLWPRTRMNPALYSADSLKEETDRVGKAVDAQLSPIRKIQATSDGRFLIVGQLGQHLQSYVYVARAPLGPLEQRIDRLWYLVAGVLAMLLLGTLGTGLLLSEQLLVPVGNLSRGIQAIRDRDFFHRVPVQSHDELGEVSTLMNVVIEGMRDLSIARTIQETLFPSGELRAGSLLIYGRSRTMSDVGGDYFDYVKLDEHRVFGLVGDVSGHGVSAALIMGMAKCFFTLNNHREAPLDEILQDFNTYLFQTVKRLKMMTLILFRWDDRKKSLELGNAGHVPAMVKRAVSGDTAEVQIPCMPLGVGKKGRFQTAALVLEPGDLVFLCTDGLPEAGDAAGNQLGYDGSVRWFAELAAREPKEVVENLFRRLDEYTAGVPAGDDVTMICLRVERP